MFKSEIEFGEMFIYINIVMIIVCGIYIARLIFRDWGI